METKRIYVSPLIKVVDMELTSLMADSNIIIGDGEGPEQLSRENHPGPFFNDIDESDDDF